MRTELNRLRALVAALLVVAWPAAAEQGHGTLGLEYQYIRTGVFDSSIGDIDIGNTDAHVLMLSGNYAITDRWLVFASLPYIRKRHTGALPHNPVLDFNEFQPPDLRIIDDGKYRGGWQDIYAGVAYQLEKGPLDYAAFISFGLPTNDYPFYGHSARGRNLWHLPVGVSASYTPYFSDWILSGDLAYVFTEKTLGVDVSHWLLNLNFSYYLTRGFAPKVFASIKYGTKGLSFPDDFDVPNLDTEEFYYHDRTIKHNWINAGIGFDWVLSDRYALSGSWFRMVDPDQVNVVDRAWTLGITWSFGEH